LNFIAATANMENQPLPEEFISKKKLLWLVFLLSISYFLIFIVRPCAVIYFVTKRYFPVEKGLKLPKKQCNCFMKQFVGWPIEDFDIATGRTSVFGASSFSIDMLHDEPYCSKNSDAIVKAGRAIYVRHAKEIDELLRNYDEIMAQPVPKYDFSKPEKDFRKNDPSNCPAIACLRPVSHYFYNSGRNADVIKLWLIVYKYSQIAANGDGYTPDVIGCLDLGSYSNTSIGGFMFWNALLNADMSAAEYNDIASKIMAVDADSLPFDAYLNLDFELTSEHVKNFINISCAALFKFERNFILKMAADKLADVKTESIRLFTVYEKRPCEFSEKIDAYFTKLRSGNSNNGLTQKISANYDLVSDMAVSMYIPPILNRIYRNYYSAARLRARSVAMMCKVLAKHRETGKWPANITEAALMANDTVPIDIFNNKPDEPLIFKNNGGKIILYSAGPDGIDNGGDFKIDSYMDEKKDMMLFQINRL